MKILKFGGSSLGNPQRIEMVKRIILESKKNSDIAVVVSAFQGVTNSLIETAKLAQRRDAKYKTAFENLKKLHQQNAKFVIRKSSVRKILIEMETLFEKLGDVLHGIYLTSELTPKMLDFTLSFGEKLSALIVS